MTCKYNLVDAHAVMWNPNLACPMWEPPTSMDQNIAILLLIGLIGWMVLLWVLWCHEVMVRIKS